MVHEARHAAGHLGTLEELAQRVRLHLRGEAGASLLHPTPCGSACAKGGENAPTLAPAARARSVGVAAAGRATSRNDRRRKTPALGLMLWPVPIVRGADIAS